MKLLVNAPTGQQELIEIGEGGGYFDPSRVIWDERVDGQLPAITLGGMVRAGNSMLLDAAMLDASVAESMAALKAAKWEDIKAERDRRESGGVLVGTKWFHSDSDSRIKWLGLKDQARDVLAAGGTMATLLQKLGQNIPWQTKDGTFALVSCQLTFDVVAATGNYSAALFAAGLGHKAAMEASADPAAYDFSGGWPVMYEAAQ